jgi:hypothetical protein
MDQQQRQQRFLAEFNTYHEALKARYGYALAIAPVTQQVQTPEGMRVEIALRFGLQEVVGWQPPSLPEALTPDPSPKGEGKVEAEADGTVTGAQG